jgi:hypothetical protein
VTIFELDEQYLHTAARWVRFRKISAFVSRAFVAMFRVARFSSENPSM